MPRNTGVLLPTLLLVLTSFVHVTRGEFPDYPMTFAEMKIKAGYYTESGKYRGGIPKYEDLSKEIYECVNDDYFYASANTTTATNDTISATNSGYATACMEWRADESAGGTFQLGNCECKSVHNEAYCEAWVCIQVKEEADCNSGGSCFVSTNTDSVLCQCDVENDSGLYCDSWSCKQVDSEGREEFEEYNCQRESPSGHYCEAWNGNVTGPDEIEIVTCECVAEWEGDRVCSYWECEELGLSTCTSSKMSWCNLGVSVGVGGGFGSLGVLAIGRGLYYECVSDARSLGRLLGLIGVVWCLGWSVGVVIWGGMEGAEIVGVIWGFLVAIACCLVGAHSRRVIVETKAQCRAAVS